jgi:hypothetical protein
VRGESAVHHCLVSQSLDAIASPDCHQQWLEFPDATRTTWGSLLHPSPLRGIRGCFVPKPWVNAPHAGPGDDATYALGDGVKGLHIPWSSNFAQDCSYPLSDAADSPGGACTHTFGVRGQGWRRTGAAMGLQSSQSVQPVGRSCRMWVCVNCIVLVDPREPSLAVMIEPVSLRGSGFSSIRVDCHQTPNRWCGPESTTQRAQGRLIGLAFCHHHVRHSKETLSAPTGVYVVSIVGICCTHLHNSPLRVGKQLDGVDS